MVLDLRKEWENREQEYGTETRNRACHPEFGHGHGHGPGFALHTVSFFLQKLLLHTVSVPFKVILTKEGSGDSHRKVRSSDSRVSLAVTNKPHY
jgi:hypothetical protein